MPDSFLYFVRGWGRGVGGRLSTLKSTFRGAMLFVFEGKKTCKEIPGEKISCPEKNIPHQETISTNRLLASCLHGLS